MVNVISAINYFAKRQPNKIAVKDDYRSISYLELSNLIKDYADYLRLNKVDYKSNVVILLENSVEFIAITMAICILGGRPVCINTKLDIAYLLTIIKEMDVNFIIGSDKVKCYKQLYKESTNNIFFIDINNINFDNNKNNQNQSNSNLHNPHIVFFTSGSTGNPKGILIDKKIFDLKYITNKNIITNNYFITRPLYFRAHFSVMCLILQEGHSLIISSNTEEMNNVNILNYNEITHLITNPNDLWSIVELMEVNDYKLVCNLKEITSTGAILSETLKNKVINLFKDVRLVNLYGTSEVGMISQIDNKEMERKKKSVGKVPFFNEIEIVSEDSIILSPMEIGYVRVKSRYLMKEYLNNSKLNKKYFSNGYFITGDLGYLDNDGYLYLVGRNDGQINVNGNHFKLEEIEGFISENIEVKNICALNYKNEKLLEYLVVFIEPCDYERTCLDKLKKDIDDICREKLAYYKVPKEIIILKKMPIGSSGKIDMIQLNNLYKNK